MSTRPLPSEIGATENALRALLEQTLTGTGVAGYERWVFLNVRDAYRDDQVLARVSAILKADEDVVLAVRSGLVKSGLLNVDGSLSAHGAGQLGEARRRVGDATARLTEGIEADHLKIAFSVLETIRARAESQLQS